jgi:hypothetical protein
MRQIYVPSKGRAGHAPTVDALTNEGLPFRLVVYEDEAKEYALAYPRAHMLLVSPEVKGLGLKRRAIHRHALSHNYDWIWQIDDDIERLFERVDDKWAPTTYELTLPAIEQAWIGQPSVVSVGLDSRHVAYWHAEDVHQAKQGTFVLMRVKGPWQYRQNHLWEDLDLTLQMLVSGHDTIKVRDWSYSAQAQAKGATGGCTADYNLRTRSELRGLIERWDDPYPGLLKVYRQGNGRPPKFVIDKNVLRSINQGD